MKRVLLLGGNGFIGGHVKTALNAAVGAECVTVGRDRLDLLHADSDQLSAVIRDERADVVVNCVGSLDAPEEALLAVHAGVTAKLLEVIARDAPTVRLIRLGSAGEYGNVAAGESVAESAACFPVSPYGESHLYATNLVRAARRSAAVEATSLRVFNPIGAGAGGNSLLVRTAEQMLTAIGSGSNTINLGPLEAWRDFVDVRDVATAVVGCALKPTAPPPVVNIGSGKAVQVREAVARLGAVCGFEGTIHEEGTGPARSAGVAWTQADISLAATELGWRPRHCLTDSAQAIWAQVTARAATH